MTEEVVLSLGRDAIWTTVMLSAPLLCAALVVGLIVSVVQAVTQINEATLTFIPKMLAIVVVLLWYFFNRTLHGKAMLATSYNRVAAELVGINTNWVLFLSFAMSAALGALGGILVTPITLTSYDVGIMLGLKGFVAAVVGGLGNGLGAVVGGLLVGILEAMGAGYISSSYKDAIPFVLILLILFFMPRGLFGGKSTDRV